MFSIESLNYELIFFYPDPHINVNCNMCIVYTGNEYTYYFIFFLEKITLLKEVRYRTIY